MTLTAQRRLSVLLIRQKTRAVAGKFVNLCEGIGLVRSTYRLVFCELSRRYTTEKNNIRSK